MVEVVAGADDLTVADTEHEDGRQREWLSSAGDSALIFELGDDDLGIGCLVDCDVGWPTALWRTGVGWPEVLAKFVAGTQRSGAKRVERVNDVGLFRIEAGQLVPAAVRHAVHECEEDLSRAARLGHGSLLSSGRTCCRTKYHPEC
jgi:hypothetical protein